MSLPSVSVVLCTYNGSKFLEQQLDSIAAQTLLPFELIACDDGSRDGTVAILEAFRQRAPFRVMIFENTENLGSTRNFDQAMQRVSGEFLALADQDDVWLVGKLARLVAVLQGDPNIGGVFSNAGLLENRQSSGLAAQKRTLWSQLGFNRRKQKAFGHRCGAIQLLLQADVVTGATLVVRTELRSLWHPIPASWVHDGWLTWMLAIHKRLEPVPEILMYYRLHDGQQLGLGAVPGFLERAETVGHTERARYIRVAAQFEDLLSRLRIGPHDPTLIGHLTNKIALLHRRAKLPRQSIPRLISIIAASRAYHTYARGWRSMRKDLFLS